MLCDSVRDAIALQTIDLNYGLQPMAGDSVKDARADGSLFHRLKFGLRKAFFICFEMTTTKGLSASQVARRYEISRQTAHYFMQKVREAMKSSESHKMNDRVQVDEFTIGGKEEGNTSSKVLDTRYIFLGIRI